MAEVTEHDFELISGPDGEWRQKTIDVEGHAVPVRISTKRDVFQGALPNARALCADPVLLEARYREFRATEAARNPRLASEVKALELDHIDFVNPARPDTAEVSFTATSGGESWMCLVVDGMFRNLVMNA